MTQSTVGNDKAITAPQIPEGWIDRTGDLLFWDHNDGPIKFIPRTVRLLDSSKDAKKVSALVSGELIEPCTLRKNDRSGNESIATQAQPGARVGVWVRGAIKELIYCRDVPCMLYSTGEMVKLKNRNDMLVVKLITKTAERNLLPLESDFRKESRKVKVPWDSVQASAPARTTEDDSDDDNDVIPF